MFYVLVAAKYNHKQCQICKITLLMGFTFTAFLFPATGVLIHLERPAMSSSVIAGS